jgi:hypothetical protein
MYKLSIKILAYIVMIPILLFGIVVSILWNGFLLADYIWVRLKRKTIAGVKEVRKTDRRD